jgi:Phage gp6-like head-tail connector protein
MAGLQVEFPAAIDPVPLAQMKNYLRVDDITDDDTLITGLISAATVACENFCKRSFIAKGFIQTLDSFPYYTDTMLSQMAYPPSYAALPRWSTTLWNYSQMIKIYRPPLISIDRITYCQDSPNPGFQDLTAQPSPWYPFTVYEVGDQVVDNNGNVETLNPTDPCSLDTMKSGHVPPTWSTVIGGITVEAAPATAVWTNEGPAPQGQFGSYIVDTIAEPARVFPGIRTTGPLAGMWPSCLFIPNAVQIHFTAGYGSNASDVPQNIITAIMMLTADYYENRTPVLKDSEEQLPRHVRALLWPSKVMDLAPTRG